MASLKDFLGKIKQRENNTTTLPSVRNIANSISAVGIPEILVLSKKDNERLGSKIAELATSDSVISDLSKALDRPKETETEDEFVNRAKSALTKILKRKLSENS